MITRLSNVADRRRGLAPLILSLALVCACVSAIAEDAALAAGEFVSVNVPRQPKLSSVVQVEADGSVQIPQVGRVDLRGLSPEQASERVSTAFSRIMRNPRVSVSRSLAQDNSAPVAANQRATNMKTELVALHNANAEVLCEALQGMSSQGGNIGYDSATNSLVLTDHPQVLQNMMNVVREVDGMQQQVTQVRIESKIAEVQEGALKELGVRWFVQGEQGGGGYFPYASQDSRIKAIKTGITDNESVSGGGGGGGGGGGWGGGRRFIDEGKFTRRLNTPVMAPTAGQMFFGFMNPYVDVGVMLDALKADSKAEMLANPQILAVNHRPAEIKMADEVPYTELTSSGFSSSNTTRFMDIGIKMLVTPHVFEDIGGRYVQMELKPEVSFTTGSNNGIPVRAVRSTNSVANVRDGQTLVIGGITLTDSRHGKQDFPVLGKVPLLGMLFRHRDSSRTKNELMVFVTPTVYDKPESVTWDRMINLSDAVTGGKPLAPASKAQPEERRE